MILLNLPVYHPKQVNLKVHVFHGVALKIKNMYDFYIKGGITNNLNLSLV